jgi:hypothetical protein
MIRRQRPDLVEELLRMDPVFRIGKLQKDGDGLCELRDGLRGLPLGRTDLSQQLKKRHIPRGRAQVLAQILLGLPVSLSLHRVFGQRLERGLSRHEAARFQMELGGEQASRLMSRVLVQEPLQQVRRFGIIAGLDGLASGLERGRRRGFLSR